MKFLLALIISSNLYALDCQKKVSGVTFKKKIELCFNGTHYFSPDVKNVMQEFLTPKRKIAKFTASANPSTVICSAHGGENLFVKIEGEDYLFCKKANLYVESDLVTLLYVEN